MNELSHSEYHWRFSPVPMFRLRFPPRKERMRLLSRLPTRSRRMESFLKLQSSVRLFFLIALVYTSTGSISEVINITENCLEDLIVRNCKPCLHWKYIGGNESP
eukprot:IDg12736t1